ncbi:MAG: response regulator [Rhodothermales bacterium]|nr:response regulator [Rhodothermales bacterium]
MKNLIPDAPVASVEGRLCSFLTDFHNTAPNDPSSQSGSLQRPSLLIVEANEEASELLELFLSPWYDLTVVHRHDFVARYARERAYQLVFMGIDEGEEQPALDALVQLRMVRVDRPPVVASVGYIDAEVERCLSRAGFDGFIKRTFTVRSLCSMLERVLLRESAFA